MSKPLAHRKVLVTAGPTWVPLDRVRVISNISSGRTGIALAHSAAQKGAHVTLLLGPVEADVSSQLSVLGVRIKRFRYFDELLAALKHELTAHTYDIIIHAAAVSDYMPAAAVKGKITSGRKRVVIVLRPTAKIIEAIRRRAPAAILVMFKLEVRRPRGRLLAITRGGMRRAKADIAVANNVDEITATRHKAYIIDTRGNIMAARTKAQIADKVLAAAARQLTER